MLLVGFCLAWFSNVVCLLSVVCLCCLHVVIDGIMYYYVCVWCAMVVVVSVACPCCMCVLLLLV